MRKVLIGLGVIVAAFIGLVFWENHTNTLSYQLRNCQNFDTGTTYAGFHCRNEDVYVPWSERSQISNLIKH